MNPSFVLEPTHLNLEYYYYRLFTGLGILLNKIREFWTWFRGQDLAMISFAITVFCLIGVAILLWKVKKMSEDNISAYADLFAKEKAPETRLDKWGEIKGHLKSDNPTEWKIAIIEADALMDEIIKKIGYKGESFSERLKNIEPSDFVNLQNVWESHKVRNRLVHEPDKIQLDKSLAEKTVIGYERALKELKYI